VSKRVRVNKNQHANGVLLCVCEWHESREHAMVRRNYIAKRPNKDPKWGEMRGRRKEGKQTEKRNEWTEEQTEEIMCCGIVRGMKMWVCLEEEREYWTVEVLTGIVLNEEIGRRFKHYIDSNKRTIRKVVLKEKFPSFQIRIHQCISCQRLGRTEMLKYGEGEKE